jgi:hypothetical protein
MQESQHQVSSAYVSRYGGAASSGQSTNMALFGACMNANGWYLQNSGETEDATKEQNARAERMCSDPRFAAIYSNTPCEASKVSDSQLSSAATISEAARANFPEWRRAVEAFNDTWIGLLRKYGGADGARQADLYLATAKVSNDRNNADLYNGLITWGEYNRKRFSIHQDYEAAAKRGRS